MQIGFAGLMAAVLLLAGGPLLAEMGEVRSVADPRGDLRMPLTEDGWFDLPSLLVPSDGSRSLGNTYTSFNDSRDRGSKIVFFDPVHGDNETADVYWWDGERIIDSAGRPSSHRTGSEYGTNPLEPDEGSIRPFRHGVGMRRNGPADPRLRTQDRDCEAVAGGYSDWFLYRRGRVHDTFDSGIVGGRSEAEPMVVAAYGPVADGRAVIAPRLDQTVRFRDSDRPTTSPMTIRTQGAKELWLHMVYSGLDIRAGWGGVGSPEADSFSGGPVTAYVEDCRWSHGPGGRLVYLPRKTWIRRSVIAFSWLDQAHNQGYFTNGFRCGTTFEETIFYRNGYKSDPRVDPDPRRDIFSRNIYQGGGARMGHQYLGIISADGGSGGPQMRLGGRIENSLILEGYWFSSTNSNKLVNPWLTESGQTGRSAVVRNNVQLVRSYPMPKDPDTAPRKSSVAAQPAWGYSLAGASFGALVEGNIVSQAMLVDDLGFEEGRSGHGIGITTRPDTYQDGKTYTQRNNTIRGNIVYRTGAGLLLGGGWSGVKRNVVEGNVFVARRAIQGEAASDGLPEGLVLRENRFYCQDQSPVGGEANAVEAYERAAASENWPDPDRTLRRYITEELGLTLLDWSDDPMLDPAARDERAASGESYDPTGMKTFMAVTTNMRRGGTQRAPATGKPSWTGDYAWDARFTGPAVVTWIRAGFGLPPAKD